MNAKRYRLVLDKRTGTLVPVADFVNTAKKGRGRGSSSQEADTHPRWGTLATALLLTVGMGAPIAGRAQQVVADPNAPSAPTVAAGPNGVPLVNIVDPNASGESVYGDSGLYVSNTLTMPLSRGFSVFAGLDAGGVRDQEPGAKTEYLSGMSTGVRANWRHGSFSLTAASPFKTTKDMSGDPVVYASTSLRF